MENSFNYRTVAQLITHILGGHAYIKLEEVLNDFPYDHIQKKVDKLPYTFYDLFEHMRLAQKDILDYCCSENYKELSWPEDYWPKENGIISKEDYAAKIDQFYEDRSRFNKWLSHNSNKLFSPIQENQNHNLLREALLLIEHNSYHTGQLVILSRILKI
ncbi:hypothetical protein KIH41_03005 [Litoribacter ruber]|uniref:hypothetical protein n=1 Tax=Litoribacter ruber TaxID=702568 RepID=UPI001BD9BB77|nr:hypothetical protein [Litoribacter ruber]MBT0810242.1 hypothetical protein [Litoribacter ruber]